MAPGVQAASGPRAAANRHQAIDAMTLSVASRELIIATARRQTAIGSTRSSINATAA